MQHAPDVAASHTPGLEGGYWTSKTPQLWPVCASRGGMEGARQAACPGCGRSAHAGAGEEVLGGGDSPAGGLQCSPGRDEGQ